MQVDILEHDLATGKAKIRFEHNGIVHTEKYDLNMVVPGTKQTLEKQGKEFTEELQLKVIDTLTEWVKNDIENGTLRKEH